MSVKISLSLEDSAYKEFEELCTYLKFDNKQGILSKAIHEYYLKQHTHYIQENDTK